MKKPLPSRRHTTSRERYWREMFNDFSGLKTDHAISGWSSQGLRLRMEAYRQALTFFELDPGALVLDLGCGAGAYSRVLGAGGFRVVGCDYAWLVAGQARKRTEHGLADYIAGDAVRLPFADDLFDHVVCVGLFQSLHNHREALQEIRRVLKPGGVLCLMTLNRCNLKARFDRLLGREDIIVVDGLAQARLNTFDPGRFIGEMEDNGFQRLSLQPVQIYPDKLSSLTPLIMLWNRLPGLRYLTARSFMVVGWKR